MYLKGDTKLVNFLCHIFYILFKKYITLDIIIFQCLKKSILMFPNVGNHWTRKWNTDMTSCHRHRVILTPAFLSHLCSRLGQAPGGPWLCHVCPIDGRPAPASSRVETIASQGFTQMPPPSQRSLPFPSQIFLSLLSSQVNIICSHFLWFCLIHWHLSAYSINLSFFFHIRYLLLLLYVFSEHNIMLHS